MEHKAFIFNYVLFEEELKDILELALQNDDITNLVLFMDANIHKLKDPYEGEPLNEHWRDMLEKEEPHQVGDFALTKFYNPIEDNGIGDDWEEIAEAFEEIDGLINNPVLGETVGIPVFDPGKMGSYFQSKEQIEINLQALNTLVCTQGSDGWEEVKYLLYAARGKGLYITF